MELDRSIPFASQVADDLRRRLDAGEWQPGDRFPGTVAIAAEYDISQSTAVRAVGVLVDEGRLRKVIPRGFFVV
ncbi:winged helix-turn-helix domain-containing protein [Streptomyces sp. OM5714]|uniref:winged helix-turn-helix domain-containing protein n=1 Tax=Streptomyces sp. OM5714 TaxID=2602736 RepID=UPI0013DD4113|nr:winged helix-turn-helix domain-containing protein [Streptomyces sp. OM5714]KAF2778707.1 GntR family transcriptional regulator [Streptomyces sp. OM5714]